MALSHTAGRAAVQERLKTVFSRSANKVSQDSGMPPSNQPSPERMKILLVDDTPENLISLEAAHSSGGARPGVGPGSQRDGGLASSAE
jgi:hypothetical protein